MTRQCIAMSCATKLWRIMSTPLQCLRLSPFAPVVKCNVHASFCFSKASDQQANSPGKRHKMGFLLQQVSRQFLFPKQPLVSQATAKYEHSTTLRAVAITPDTRPERRPRFCVTRGHIYRLLTLECRICQLPQRNRCVSKYHHGMN